MQKAIRALTLLVLATASQQMLNPYGARAEDAAVETLSVNRRISSLRCARGRAARLSKASMRVPAKKFVSSDSGQ